MELQYYTSEEEMNKAIAEFTLHCRMIQLARAELKHRRRNRHLVAIRRKTIAKQKWNYSSAIARR